MFAGINLLDHADGIWLFAQTINKNMVNQSTDEENMD